MDSGETPKPNNKASVTFPNTTNPPQSSPPTDHHHQQQLIAASTDDHDVSSPQTVPPPAAAAEEEEHAGGGIVNGRRRKFERDFVDDLPSGYRFHPTDEELVVEYLMPEMAKEPKHLNRIHTVDIFKYHPRKLADFREFKENEWYFFTPRWKKYANGSRPDRSAGDGYWKATGADRKIYSNGVQVGARMSLVFHTGKHPKGVKTNWMMHEFTANTPPTPSNTKGKNQSNDDMMLDKCVLCRIYNKEGNKDGKRRPPDEEENGTEPIPQNEVEVEVGEDDDDNIGDGIINNQEMLDQGMMNYNSDYISSLIPQSILHPNPNPIHHLHDPPKHLHSETHHYSPNSFNPDSFNPNSFNPNSNHCSNIASSSHHQVHDPPTALHFNTHDLFHNSLASSSRHQLPDSPRPLHFNTHGLFPNSLASSSHQLPDQPPRHLYPNSHVYTNSFNPNSFDPNHSCYTGLVINDATLSSLNNLGDFASMSSYPFNVDANANLENFASPSFDPPRAHATSNELSTSDYIGNPDPCDFSYGLSPLASHDYHQITDHSTSSNYPNDSSTSNYPHSHQDYHAGVSGAGESQLLTNPDQLTQWDQFEGDQQTHPHQ